MKRMLLAIAVLGASAMDAEIDVPLDRSQWETLKALGAPDPNSLASGWSGHPDAGGGEACRNP